MSLPTEISSGDVAGGLRRWRIPLNILLIVGALAYIALASREHWHEWQRTPLHLSAWQVVGVIGMSVAAIAASSIYHALAIKRLQETSVTLTRLALAYAIGQIVRYLPGKVMGVVFEANFLAPRIRVPTIAFASLVQMLMGNAWAAVFAFAVLYTGVLNQLWPLFALLPAALLLYLAHRRAWPERFLLRLPIARRYADPKMRAHLCTAPHALLASLILVLEWLPFLVGWWILLAGLLTPLQAATLGAGYLLASLASTALIVVPSGIVIREAMFVWIGSHFGFPLPLLLVCGLILRIALTLADLLNVALFWIADAIQMRRDTKLPKH